MRLGDLLTRAKLVTPEQVAEALRLQMAKGGRLGVHLIAMGAITQAALDGFLHKTPTEPESLAATGLSESELLSLLIKLIYTQRLESTSQFVQAIKLPYPLVSEMVGMAVDSKLLYTLGSRGAGMAAELRYGFTEAGQKFAAEAFQQLRYAGPAPVSLEAFTRQVNLQKVTNELVTFERIREALGDLTIEERMVEQSGPALNSGKAMLLYGPPGNGKTSYAMRLATAYSDLIWVPYAVSVEGQVIRMHDPRIHFRVNAASREDDGPLVFREEFDARWVPCKRPFVLAGGELTLEMLDLRYDAVSNFYEAPLHMKALGGCFVIDDFGRQLLSPTSLLNRWIVPLENRVDYLKLHTGKSFRIPFEELVIFSTNLEPEDLMDPAFLRRLPYKIQIGAPSLTMYRRMFDRVCEAKGLTLGDELFDSVVHKITVESELPLAAYQPLFLVEQALASCRFMGEPAQLNPLYIDYAIDNLRVRRFAASTS
jgi:hypothetical protein